MTNGFDLPTAILCLVMAAALCELFALSSPKHKKWLSLPWYVRLGFLATAVGMGARGAELFSLSSPSGSSAVQGHVDPAGFLLTISMTFTFVALAAHAILSSLPVPIRCKIERAERLAHIKPHGEVLATLVLQGVTVVEPMGKLPDL